MGLDQFPREGVGWALQPRMTADSVTDALTMAWFRRKPAVGLRPHSDRGRPCASQPFQHKLKAYGRVYSMSRNGNGWNHAPTERGFNSFKNERVHGLREASRAEMTAASVEYLEVFYNRTQRHSTLDDQSPMQCLDEWRMAQHEENLVA
jgi:transposase InsO family protein